jgi:hypothetical protein
LKLISKEFNMLENIQKLDGPKNSAGEPFSHAVHTLNGLS